MAIAGNQLIVPANFWTTYSPAATATVTRARGHRSVRAVELRVDSSSSYKANPNYWGWYARGERRCNVPSYSSNTAPRRRWPTWSAALGR